MEDLYKNIKARREELGMTQTELAKLVGYSDKTMVSRVEHGKIDISQNMLKKFSEALDITIPELMGWDQSQVLTDLRIPIDPNRFSAEDVSALINVEKNQKLTNHDEVSKRIKLYYYVLKSACIQRLIDSAMNCSDAQIEVAINVLNSYTQKD